MFHGRMNLAKYVQAQLKELAEISQEVPDPSEGLHELRLSIKRLRAFCQLVRPLEPSRASALLLHLKGLSRTVSDLRDQEVVKTWWKAHPKIRRSLKLPSTRSPEKPLHREIVTSVADEVLSFRKELLDLARLCEHRLDHPIVARSYRRAAKAWRLALRTHQTKNFHRARRRLKDVQYQLELFDDSPDLSFIRKPARLGKRLRELTTILGEANDTVLVESQLRRRVSKAKITRIRTERVKLHGSALQLAKKLHLLHHLQP